MASLLAHRGVGHFFIVVVSAVLVAVVFRPCGIVLWGRQWVAGGVEGHLLKGIQVDGDRIEVDPVVKRLAEGPLEGLRRQAAYTLVGVSGYDAPIRHGLLSVGLLLLDVLLHLDHIDGLPLALSALLAAGRRLLALNLVALVLVHTHQSATGHRAALAHPVGELGEEKSAALLHALALPLGLIPLEVILYVLLVCRGGAEAHATQSALTGPTLVQLLQEADVQVKFDFVEGEFGCPCGAAGLSPLEPPGQAREPVEDQRHLVRLQRTHYQLLQADPLHHLVLKHATTLLVPLQIMLAPLPLNNVGSGLLPTAHGADGAP
mmetsp:Transcript_15551/g.44457  ORF Transcript_15551/g.44457 Transcript_15551/m.44457 type:complete len:319 (-) Transcript_15551:203-1159(-)